MKIYPIAFKQNETNLNPQVQIKKDVLQQSANNSPNSSYKKNSKALLWIIGLLAGTLGGHYAYTRLALQSSINTIKNSISTKDFEKFENQCIDFNFKEKRKYVKTFKENLSLYYNNLKEFNKRVAAQKKEIITAREYKNINNNEQDNNLDDDWALSTVAAAGGFDHPSGGLFDDFLDF